MRLEDKHEQMTRGPLAPLIARLSLPAIIANVVGVAYNLTDTFYVGRIGTDATAALGIDMPIMVLMQAFGLLFGAGAGNRISVLLGKKDRAQSEKHASTAIFSAFALSCLGAATLGAFKNDLVFALGSTRAVAPFASAYLFPILLASPLYSTSYAYDPLLRFQGMAKESMVGISFGAILNIFLEPVFIFSFHLGMLGAGAATAICQAVSFAILGFLYWKKSDVKLGLKKFSLKSLKPVLSSGMPNFVRNAMGAVSTDVFNLAAAPFGAGAIAGVAISSRILLFTTSMEIGLGRGYQPVCGYSYGAKKYGRIEKGYYMILSASLAILIFASVFQFVFAPQLVSLFRNSKPVIGSGSDLLRFSSVTFPLYSFIICSNMMQQTLGHALAASIVGLARQGLFLVPLLLTLPGHLGFFGLEICQPISDFLAFLLTLPFQVKIIKSLRKLKMQAAQNLG